MPWALVVRYVGLYVALPLLVYLGFSWFMENERSKARAVGRSEVTQQWDQERAKAAEKARTLEAQQRAAEHEDWRRNERIRDEQLQLAQAQEEALAAATSERQRLRATIARLNAQGRPGGDSGGQDQQTGRGPDGAASQARELLAECSDRREEVARDAGSLARQVLGLQAWARSALQTCGRSDNSEEAAVKP